MQSVIHFYNKSNGGKKDLMAVLGKTTVFLLYYYRVPKMHKIMYNTLLGKVIDWVA